MAFRDWRLRRVIGLSVLWMIAVVAFAALRAALAAMRIQSERPGQDVVIVFGHVPGGKMTLFLPPLVLLISWWWIRRKAIPAPSEP